MKTPIRLGVNVDHVATLRQARGTRYPDPVQAAIAAEQAGADLITMHLREDRRHIQDRDILLAKSILQTRLNLEMAVTEAMIDFAETVQPADCCLVPERREELTTEGGLDVEAQLPRITEACQRLGKAGIKVSLFIDPVNAQIEAAKASGAPVIELHTGTYADAVDETHQQQHLRTLQQAAEYAHALGLQVNAGHGLHYHNVLSVAKIPQLCELNIGHAIMARAIFTGLDSAVREMRQLLIEARYWEEA